ncbi:MAG: type I secretion C-terminal target domain-containing protein, partial [Neisseriaceae bacterium]|nr:type I secretion C-terminal target domain-containing protein [Neisseriaceae bacterium]
EPGSKVDVKDGNGDVIGSGTADQDGNFVVTLDPALTNGEEVTITATDKGNNESAGTDAVAPDSTAPNAPTDLAVNEEGNVLTGKAEPETVVRVFDASGVLIGQGVTNAQGHFVVSLSPAQTNGELLNVNATDAADNTSANAPVVAQDTTAPDAPSDVIIDADGLVVTGQTEPDAKIEIKDAAGAVIGEGLADGEGHFTITLTPAQTNGEQLSVTAADGAGNVSEATDVTAPTIVPEVVALADNHVELGLDVTPTASTNSNTHATGFTIASVGLGAILELGVLDEVIKSALTIDVAENTARQITLKGTSGGVQILSTYDLYMYKLNETSGQWEQQRVEQNWIKAVLLGGTSKELPLLLDSGKYMFVLGTGLGVTALTGSTIKTVSDVTFDYGKPEAVSGETEGNLMTDNDPKHGADDVPEGTAVSMVNGIAVSGNDEVAIKGLFGTLYVKADGSYRYEASADFKGPYGAQETFKYSVTTPKGNTAEADLTIKLNNGGSDIEVGDIDSHVVLDLEANIEKGPGVKAMTDFAVIKLGLLGPILGADAVVFKDAMTFDVSENTLRELTFKGAAGGVELASSYDLLIYKLDEITGQYVQFHVEKSWFKVILLGGGSDPLTLQFPEGKYKVLLGGTSALGLLSGSSVSVTEDKIHNYGDPKKLEGKAQGDVTPDDADVVVKVAGQDVSAMGTTITGKFGILTIAADGSYTYVVSKSSDINGWQPPYGKVDTFSYVTQSADGKTTVSTLNIKIGTTTAIDDFVQTNVVAHNQVDHVDFEGSTGILSNTVTKDFNIAAGTKTEATLNIKGSTGILGSNTTITYQIIDKVSGKVVKTGTKTEKNPNLNVTINDLEPGQYTLSVVTKDGSSKTSFVSESTHLSHFNTGVAETESGNLFANDIGKDSINAFTVGGKTLFVDSNVGAKSATVEGLYGTLTLSHDGSYSYKASGNGYGVERFEYSLDSKVGTSDKAILEINVGKDIMGSKFDDVVTSTAGNDVYALGEGADTVVMKLLDQADAAGGNGQDTWTDFKVGMDGDRLDISDLLDDNVAPGNLAEYLSVREEGGNTIISVDRDGQGSAFEATEVMTLTGVNTTLDELLANHQITY